MQASVREYQEQFLQDPDINATSAQRAQWNPTNFRCVSPGKEKMLKHSGFLRTWEPNIAFIFVWTPLPTLKRCRLKDQDILTWGKSFLAVGRDCVVHCTFSNLFTTRCQQCLPNHASQSYHNVYAPGNTTSGERSNSSTVNSSCSVRHPPLYSLPTAPHLNLSFAKWKNCPWLPLCHLRRV